MKKFIIVLSLLTLNLISFSQKQFVNDDTFIHSVSSTYESPTDPDVLDNLDKWQDKKLGIMFHWGVYSIPGIPESWALCSEERFTKRRINANPECKSYGDFKKWYWNLAEQFNPTEFDPYEWAQIMKKNGFKYLIFTTKHHDGFCMFDTRQTDYKVTNTPYKNGKYADITYHLFDAFRNQGFMIGAYFSKPDWHNENYWDPFLATPDRNPNYDIEKNPERWAKFKKYTAAQINELMSNYGRIDILWCDGGWVRKPKQDIDMDALADMARSKQPGIIVVDRTVPGRNENYLTPEQAIPKEQLPYPWETCLTLSNSWGWNPNPKYKSAQWAINSLIEIVAKGGCLALNIGPNGRGRFDEVALERINILGDWLRRNGEAIYNTRTVKCYNSKNIWFTANKDKKTIYAIYALPEDEVLPHTIKWKGNEPKGKMTLLSNGNSVSYTVKDGIVTVDVPAGTQAESLVFKFKTK